MIQGERPNGAVEPTMNEHKNTRGKARTWILLWLIGVPLPILLLMVLLRSCA